jgi:hypothetical protein
VGNPLGLPFDPEESDEEIASLFGDDEIEAQEQETPAPVLMEDEPDEEEAAETPLAQEGDEGEPEEEVAGEQPARLFADRFPSVETLEKSYKELQGAFTRVTQENRQMVQMQERQTAEIDQIKAFLLQQTMESDPDLAEQWQQQARMDEMMSQRVQEQVAPLQERLQAEAFMREAENVVAAFWRDHDIRQNDDTDRAIARTMDELVTAGVPLSPANREHLELALEAAQNPALKFELASNPRALVIPGGADFLRQKAGATMQTASGSPSGAQPKPRGTVRRRVEAHVETSGSGQPSGEAPGTKPKDEFDEAADWYMERFKKGPLFGSAR